MVLAGSTEALSGHAQVTLLDVSRTGARISGTGLPHVGREIILKCGPIDTFGTIAWTASGRCGVHFDEPLSLRDLVTLRVEAAKEASSEMTSEERQAAADWMNGLAR